MNCSFVTDIYVFLNLPQLLKKSRLAKKLQITLKLDQKGISDETDYEYTLKIAFFLPYQSHNFVHQNRVEFDQESFSLFDYWSTLENTCGNFECLY